MAILSFKPTFRHFFLGLLGLFCLVFALRFLGGFLKNDSSGSFQNESGGLSFFDGQSGLRKNYASEKSRTANQAPPYPGEANQKYEKTASLAARSDEFENDEKAIRGQTGAFGAIIQYENKSGNKGSRSLQLMIGVKPELFDSFYVEVQKIGHIHQNSITKVDKSTEFRELNGKKASLEKALASLNDLKTRAGSISDLVSLHEKILDVERQMQELGVELGNFSAENEFCTVRFSIAERAGARSISMAARIWRAFEWTIERYFFALAGLVFLAFAAWLFSVVLGKVSPEKG